VIILIAGLILFTEAFSQAEKNRKDSSPFIRGIHLENLNVTIPWGASFEDLKKIGNPKFELVENTKKGLVWDSVVILSGVKTTLYFFPRKHKDFFKVIGIVDSTNEERFKASIIDYRGSPDSEKSGNSSKKWWYIWNLKDGLIIQLVHDKKWGKRNSIFIQSFERN
jgi:hypothetical protein